MMARVAHESSLPLQVIQMAKYHRNADLPQLVSEPWSSVFIVIVVVVVIFLWMRVSLPFEAEDQPVGSIS